MMNKLTNIFDVSTEYYTITDLCRSEYEFVLTCKLILTEAEE